MTTFVTYFGSFFRIFGASFAFPTSLCFFNIQVRWTMTISGVVLILIYISCSIGQYSRENIYVFRVGESFSKNTVMWKRRNNAAMVKHIECFNNLFTNQAIVWDQHIFIFLLTVWFVNFLWVFILYENVLYDTWSEIYAST